MRQGKEAAVRGWDSRGTGGSQGRTSHSGGFPLAHGQDKVSVPKAGQTTVGRDSRVMHAILLHPLFEKSLSLNKRALTTSLSPQCPVLGFFFKMLFSSDSI